MQDRLNPSYKKLKSSIENNTRQYLQKKKDMAHLMDMEIRQQMKIKDAQTSRFF
jgi:translation elongation factor P/translation initiation factor 5A